MASLSDYIERYLRNMLREANKSMIKIKRVELADRFRCVPSQINYVLKTRFTPERGYLIESRRGEGGYIRIIKISSDSEQDLLIKIYRAAGGGVSRKKAAGYVDRLRDETILTEREAALMRVALDVRGSGGMTDEQRGNVLCRFIKVLLRTSN